MTARSRPTLSVVSGIVGATGGAGLGAAAAFAAGALPPGGRLSSTQRFAFSAVHWLSVNDSAVSLGR